MWLSAGLITCELLDSAPRCLFIGLQPAICFSFTFTGTPLRPSKSELNLPDFYCLGLKVKKAWGWLFKSHHSWDNLAVRRRHKKEFRSIKIILFCIFYLHSLVFIFCCQLHENVKWKSYSEHVRLMLFSLMSALCYIFCLYVFIPPPLTFSFSVGICPLIGSCYIQIKDSLWLCLTVIWDEWRRTRGRHRFKWQHKCLTRPFQLNVNSCLSLKGKLSFFIIKQICACINVHCISFSFCSKCLLFFCVSVRPIFILTTWQAAT